MGVDDVVTLAEASVMWCRHRDTIMRAIWRGKLQARQTMTGQYLIMRSSLVSLWGEPIQDCPEYSIT